MDSLQELIQTAHDLAVSIGYDDNGIVREDIIYDTPCSADLVWDVIDLGYNWIIKRVSGQCSLRELIDFNIQNAEEKVRDDIKIFEMLITLNSI